jgi:hypothetical protein
MSTSNSKLSVKPISSSTTDFSPGNSKFLVKQVLTDPLGLNKPTLPSTAIVSGDAQGDKGNWTGVYGQSERSIAIYGKSPVFAGMFDGDVQIYGDLTQESGVATFANANLANLTVSGDIMMANADCAEDFDVDELWPGEPGTVMVVGDAGVLHPGRQAYDKRVAGVISGAGDYKPGMVFDKQQSQRSRQPIALLGKVFCKVDAQYASIEVGDLLTTSGTLGHAMKAIEPLKAFGAVIGKALRPFREGQGLIPILIALQ